MSLFTREKPRNTGTSFLHHRFEFVHLDDDVLTSERSTPDIMDHLNYEMSVYQGVRFYEETQRQKEKRQHGDKQLHAEYTAKLDDMLEKSRIRLKEDVLLGQEELTQQDQSEAIAAVRSKLSVSETLSPYALEKDGPVRKRMF